MKQNQIVIINYGMGNIGSICNALDYLGGRYIVSSDPGDFSEADAFILPGVGSFGVAAETLRRLDLIPVLDNEIQKNGKPFLGICLGMQLAAEDSVEGGCHKGFAWIQGHVRRLAPKGELHVPHVGWNTVRVCDSDLLFTGIPQDSHFYFDHSYHLTCPSRYVTATCQYGGYTVAAIRNENIFATQFHPEKSQRTGLKLLRNYLNFIRDG